MKVWFMNKERFEEIETDKISRRWILEKMKELGMRKARVVSWHPNRVEPNDWGVFILKQEEGRQ